MSYDGPGWASRVGNPGGSLITNAASENYVTFTFLLLDFYVSSISGSTSKGFPSKNESLFPASLWGVAVAHTADVLQCIYNSITAANVYMDIIFRPSLANGLNLCMPFWATKEDGKHGV